MALTDLEVANAKVLGDNKLRKLTDQFGLYLLINRSGKYWRYDYKIFGNRKTYSLGSYPSVPLAGKTVKGTYIKGARELLVEVKALVKQGIDPSLAKQESKQQATVEQEAIVEQKKIDEDTFEKLARGWHAIKKQGWSEKHAFTIMSRFERHVFPFIGAVPVVELNKAQVADVITGIVAHGTTEIATRIGQIIRQVLEYCCDKGLIELVPMGNVKNLIPVRKVKPMPAIIEPARTGELMRAIYNYKGSYVVCQALRLLPLLAARSGEFRAAQWNEFDLNNSLWTIPAAHRKLPKLDKEDPENIHLVPLSAQAVVILRDLHRLTGTGNHAFPSVRGDSRPMSENTINLAIHAMGFDDMVGHGWRTVFSTVLNEQGFNSDAIERQLAHTDKDKVRAAYNRSEYLEERTRMMQHWADYLDQLRDNI